ncbi:DUF559 domain-containing protein [Methylobacterium sp. E-041]|uniref:DUF559 domain-containing protein n=1 Tax=Methylobacterium sp. E-041 TaxID=2836573 RepID=UPI001FBB631B|nr:DUF559 domain-containing protein [Methylobacterium sp. E-041]MCJ2105128.1 DUF559 domain-containing protein [Methylobacterium sp. E-041]
MSAIPDRADAAGCGDAPRRRLPLGELGRTIQGLRAGERLVLVGIGCDGVGAALDAAGAAERGVLFLEADAARTAEAVLDRLLDDFADLALSRWPDWHGLDAAADAAPDDLRVSRPWLRAAAKRAGAGAPPRFRHLDRGFELAQLLRTIDPAGVALVAEVDPSSPVRAAALIEALERCAACGAALVVALPAAPPPMPPFDRVLYGAYEVLREPVAAAVRFIPARSRAHPASAVERRMEDALARDADLAGLFEGNARVLLGGGRFVPRVDLLWEAGGVVVELDGPEHRAAAAFDADRHRDYELLVAGYLVLRLTNAQVEADPGLAIEKIRAVVRRARALKGFR